MGASALGIAGLGLGFLQNQQARGDANKANAGALEQAQLNYLLQKGIVDRSTGLFDTLRGIVSKADAGGQFDPGTFLARLRDDTALNQSQDLGNAAGAMRIMGMRPGDSEFNTRTDAIRNKYDLNFRQQDAGIREGLFNQKLGAYEGLANVLQGVGNNANGANAALQGQYNAMAQQAYGQMQNPGGLIASILPYLQKSNQPGTNAMPTPAGKSPQLNYYGNGQLPSLYNQLQQFYSTGQNNGKWGF